MLYILHTHGNQFEGLECALLMSRGTKASGVWGSFTCTQFLLAEHTLVICTDERGGGGGGGGAVASQIGVFHRNCIRDKFPI